MKTPKKDNTIVDGSEDSQGDRSNSARKSSSIQILDQQDNVVANREEKSLKKKQEYMISEARLSVMKPKSKGGDVGVPECNLVKHLLSKGYSNPSSREENDLT